MIHCDTSGPWTVPRGPVKSLTHGLRHHRESDLRRWYQPVNSSARHAQNCSVRRKRTLSNSLITLSTAVCRDRDRHEHSSLASELSLHCNFTCTVSCTRSQLAIQRAVDVGFVMWDYMHTSWVGTLPSLTEAQSSVDSGSACLLLVTVQYNRHHLTYMYTKSLSFDAFVYSQFFVFHIKTFWSINLKVLLHHSSLDHLIAQW